MAELGSRWRFFWSQRSGGRVIIALICAILALLPAIFLALPLTGRLVVLRVISAIGQDIGLNGLQITLEGWLVVFACVSFALLLAPGYRQYRYLTIPTSLIAPVSVYVDAENILSEKDIPALSAHIRKFLDERRADNRRRAGDGPRANAGLRADLLFFMDASLLSSNGKYRALYRAGFRPIHVPHNPTGKKTMTEAVDREIAMHALERALLGPARQEFIIISSDADFAPLVYRLIALGHSVQIWSSTTVNAYNRLARYLPLTLTNLRQILSEQRDTTPSQSAKPGAQAQTAKKRVAGAESAPSVAPSLKLSVAAQEQLYNAIAETLSAREECERTYKEDAARSAQFRLLLTSRLAPRIASVGYSAGAWMEYWRAHLEAAGLIKTSGAGFPLAGEVSAQVGARGLAAIVQASADAALRATSTRPDGLLNMQVILAQFEASGPAADVTPMLRALVAAENKRRTTHMRYFVRCARALGLIQFDDTSLSPDLIANPRALHSPEPTDGLNEGGDNNGPDSV